MNEKFFVTFHTLTLNFGLHSSIQLGPFFFSDLWLPPTTTPVLWGLDPGTGAPLLSLPPNPSIYFSIVFLF
jgi:hypothetical protein